MTDPARVEEEGLPQQDAADGPRRARHTLGRSYPAIAPSVANARRTVTSWLHEHGADALMIGDIAVAVSEACTNVVVHAYRDHPSDGHIPLFRVVARVEHGIVTVTVADNGTGMHPRPDSPGVGLGVALMATLSDRVEVRTGEDGAGTVVAMLFSEAGARRRTLRSVAPIRGV